MAGEEQIKGDTSVQEVKQDIKNTEKEKNDGDRPSHNRRGRGNFGGARGPRGDNHHQGNRQHGRDHRAGDKGNRSFPHHQQQQQQHNQPMDIPSGIATYPTSDKKPFTGRSRLFVGNLTGDISEDDFKAMFTPHGELSEVFLNSKKGFGFVRLDTRQNAEAAKAALDGTQRNGRTLRIRFATHGAALKVKYLSPYVSNEQLEHAFSQFGTLERAVVIVDDRGRSTGEGIVEFARKPGAMQAINKINEGVFIMGSNPRPIIVEPLEQKDEEDGMPEKFMQRTPPFLKEREEEPHFAPPGSFEYEFGGRWKQLYDMEKQQQEQLRKNLEEAVEKLEMEQESALLDHQTRMLRQDLMRRQEELRRFEEQRAQELSRRQEMLSQRLNNSGSQNALMSLFTNNRRQDERMPRGADDDQMRRRQQMDDQRGGSAGGMRGGRGDDQLLLQQEAAIREMQGGHRGNAPPMPPPPAPPASMGLDRPRNQGGIGNNQQQNMGGNASGGGGGGSMGNLNNQSLMDGGNANNQSANMRQSRFDQPPSGMGGGYQGNMGIGMGGGNNMMGGGNNSGMGGGMRNERGGLLDKRDRPPRDDFYDNKRPRRF